MNSEHLLGVLEFGQLVDMYQLLKHTLLFMIVCDLVAIAKASAYVLCDCVALCCDHDDGLAFPGLCNPKVRSLRSQCSYS